MSGGEGNVSSPDAGTASAQAEGTRTIDAEAAEAQNPAPTPEAQGATPSAPLLSFDGEGNVLEPAVDNSQVDQESDQDISEAANTSEDTVDPNSASDEEDSTQTPGIGETDESSEVEEEVDADPVEDLKGKELKDAVDARIKEARRTVNELKTAGVIPANSDLALKVDMGLLTGKVGEQNPQNLKSLMQALSEARTLVSDPQESGAIVEAHSNLSRNVSVLYEGKLYRLSSLVVEKGAADSSRQIEIDRIINDGEYAVDYDFERSVLNNDVDQQLPIAKRKLVASKGTAMEKVYKAQVDALTRAQEAKGEGGGIFAVKALSSVQDKDVQTRLAQYGDEVEARSWKIIDAQMENDGYTLEERQAFRQMVNENNIVGLAKMRKVKKSGIFKSMFGPNSNKVMKEVIPSKWKKYSKAGALGLLLVAFSGLNEFQSVLRAG